jgi:hypothetical protein
MKRTALGVVAGVVVGAFALASCSISIGGAAQGSSSPVSPAAPSTTAAGATYLALVGPVNTATFALDTAVFGSAADLTTHSLAAAVAASSGAIKRLDDHLRAATWPRTAEPDVTTLAATNDVLVVLLQGFESDLQSPTSGADFSTVVRALQSEDSPYAIDRGRASDDAARVRADLGLPPPSAPHVTLND